MNTTSRPALSVAALVLSTSPLLLAVPASADTSGDGSGTTKAGIEYSERQAAGGDRPSKAQIEQKEREQARGGGEKQPGTTSSTSGGGSGATAWQLALSAALGAGLTGAVVVASRQVSQHRQPVAQ